MSDLGHVVVIGGGIAGVSAAYYLAMSRRCDRLTLIEAEPQLAHHTTGRSAALLTENYGAGPVRPLTTASLDFFHNPPPHLVDQPLITRRGIMTISFSVDTHQELDRQLVAGKAAVQPIVEIDLAQAAELAPHVRFEPSHRVMWEAQAYDIDVAALHQAFVRGIRAQGGTIETARRMDTATPKGSGWRVETSTGSLRADVIVNAAGAWADLVAIKAGVAPVGLTPLKRTAFMTNSPLEGSARFAFVAQVNHDWYLRPDGAQFMCSPADEQPSEPCDARADEIDIARTIDMINDHTCLGIKSVNSYWAGLRTFSPDRSMVVGRDPVCPSFVWCAGQGGTGIQTAPGAGQLLADLVVHEAPRSELTTAGLDLSAIAPDRFSAAT